MIGTNPDYQVPGDLALVNYQLVWLLTDAQRAQYYVQKVRARFQFFLGEWFLNQAEGVPYFRDIFVVGVQLADVSRILRRVLSTTPGLVSIESFTLEKSAPRVARIQWQATFDAKLVVSDGPFELGF